MIQQLKRESQLKPILEQLNDTQVRNLCTHILNPENLNAWVNYFNMRGSSPVEGAQLFQRAFKRQVKPYGGDRIKREVLKSLSLNYLKNMRDFCDTLPEEDNEEQRNLLERMSEIDRERRGRVDADGTQGYVPFGLGTTVSPGTWIRFEVEDMSEYTTSYFNEKGEVESKVYNLLDMQGGETRRAVCASGVATRCEEFKMTKESKVIVHNGNLVPDLDPDHQVKVKEFTCDDQDTFWICPYTKKVEEVIGYNRAWNCFEETEESGGDMLTGALVGGVVGALVAGSSKKSKKQVCRMTSEVPIKMTVQRHNCKNPKINGTEINSGYEGGDYPAVMRCKNPKYVCKRWSHACHEYELESDIVLMHENAFPKWRPLRIHDGEMPFDPTEKLFLEFRSPVGVVTQCKLTHFKHKWKDNVLMFKIPTQAEENEKIENGQPFCKTLTGQVGRIWTDETIQVNNYPRLFIKNKAFYEEDRSCGQTRYRHVVKETTRQAEQEVFRNEIDHKIGPMHEFCTHSQPTLVHPDLRYKAKLPIRFKGKLSVIGGKSIFEGMTLD